MPVSTLIQIRRDTAVNWTSNNPLLAAGEIGYETNTAKYKIGVDAGIAWNSLAYGGMIGPTQTQVIKFFGDGSDGNVTISSGITVLVRDMYYNNLTLNGTGIISTAGYRIFIAGTLDITASGAGAIRFNGNNGQSTATSIAAAAPVAQGSNSVSGPNVGVIGVLGTTGNGATGTSGASASGANGGSGGNGGAGGAGSTGTSGPGGTGGVSSAPLTIRRYETELLKGIVLIKPGLSGGAGGAGGGDGVNAAGASGSSGNGGGLVAIWANIINRGGSTSADTIQVNGGLGGSSGMNSTGNTGGGGGAGGGGGGWIIIFYNTLTGSTATNALQAAGGAGGAGGQGFGTGIGGNGGSSGAGGRITLINVLNSTATDATGSASVSGSNASGNTPGAGAVLNTFEVSL